MALPVVSFGLELLSFPIFIRTFTSTINPADTYNLGLKTCKVDRVAIEDLEETVPTTNMAAPSRRIVRPVLLYAPSSL